MTTYNKHQSISNDIFGLSEIVGISFLAQLLANLAAGAPHAFATQGHASALHHLDLLNAWNQSNRTAQKLRGKHLAAASKYIHVATKSRCLVQGPRKSPLPAQGALSCSIICHSLCSYLFHLQRKDATQLRLIVLCLLPML